MKLGFIGKPTTSKHTPNNTKRKQPMKVKYLIEQLKEYDPDDELIIAYWDRDHVAMNLNRDINDDQWANIICSTEKAIDCLDWWGDIRWTAIETLETGDNQ